MCTASSHRLECVVMTITSMQPSLFSISELAHGYGFKNSLGKHQKSPTIVNVAPKTGFYGFIHTVLMAREDTNESEVNPINYKLKYE